MKLKIYKKYLGLCQCKGCLKFYDTIVAVYPTSGGFYPAKLCSIHACDAIRIPFVDLGRF